MSRLSKPETRISRRRHEISSGNFRVVKMKLALDAKVCRRRGVQNIEPSPSDLGCFLRASSTDEIAHACLLLAAMMWERATQTKTAGGKCPSAVCVEAMSVGSGLSRIIAGQTRRYTESVLAIQ